MPDKAVIARLSRSGAALASVGIGPGGLAVRDVRRADQPTLDALGQVLPSATAVLRTLAAGLDAGPVTLALPPGVSWLARATVEIPLAELVKGATIDGAAAEARAAFAAEGRAVLTCRPYGYAVDDERHHEAPVGARGTTLSVDVVGALAALEPLSVFDRTLRNAGLALSGVVTATDALAAAMLDDGEGSAILVDRETTLAVTAENGVAVASASAPIGRRHVESDLAQACALEPAEAARRADAVLSGTSSDDEAISVVGLRLTELSELLIEEAGRRNMDLRGARLFGLPPRAATKIADAVAIPPSEARALQPDPLLIGTAYLALGLRGGLGPATLAAPKPRSWTAWLRERF